MLTMPWTPAPFPADAVALAARGRHVFAALADGAVAASRDGGRQWDALAPAPAAGPTALAAAAGTLVLATCGGVFVHATGAAAAGGWARAAGVPDGALVLALAVAGASRVVAGTLRHGVLGSATGGRTWTPAGDGLPLGGDGLEVHALAAVGARVFAAHAFGVHRSPDGGRSWAPAAQGLPLGAARADLASDGRAAFAGVDGRLFETADGERWDELDAADPPGGALHLVGAAGRALFALDAGGALVASASGGARWQPAGDGLPGLPEAVAGTREGIVAALGPDGLWRHPALDDAADAARPEIALGDAHPNPLGRFADLSFSLSAPARVLLTVHDALDREVARPAEGPFAAGAHRVRFAPGALPAGLYRWRLAAGGRAQARPLVVLGDPR